MISDKLALTLLEAAERVCTPAFIPSDPVQFPRRFSAQTDIEITSLLISHIAWGNRKMICRDAERLLDIMEQQPTVWLREAAYEELNDDLNIHRTFFARNLKHFCRGLRSIYEQYPSLDTFCAASGAPSSATPAWHLAEALNHHIAQANGGITDPRCLPLQLNTSALKRLNMALRWLVRQECPVDLGIWQSLSPAQLFIPLDVHVGNMGRQLGLITRRANDRRTVIDLTDALRSIRPHDPTYFDFALFALDLPQSS